MSSSRNIGALHAIVGSEEEHPTYDMARIRALGVCYDIRHALMGNREMEFVENGLDDSSAAREQDN